jgi:polyferredoxin
MRISVTRRIVQVTLFALFLWFCIAATVGTAWHQWRGWPIRWFLEMDPLVAVGTILSTHSLYAGLFWALAIVVLTLLFGRVFCGWICPFGALHQFVGWLGRFGKRPKDKMAANEHRPASVIKYYLLIAMLCAASGNLVLVVLRSARGQPALGLALFAVLLLALAWLTARQILGELRRSLAISGLVIAVVLGLGASLTSGNVVVNTLQTGLLDPIPLLSRSINLFLLPVLDTPFETLFPSQRFYDGAGLIGAVFLGFVLANLAIPRFFCRFVCPTGALLGVIGRWAPWGIVKTDARCTECTLCDVDCEGACNPMGPIKVSECLMCMNCLENCPTWAPIAYGERPSPGGEEPRPPGVSRRGFVVSAAAGLAAVPLARLGATTGANWPAGLIRPPGSVAEEEFLARCIKCCECIRVCPTNVLQPSGFAHGLEGLWTPVLNNRIGTSGCQLNCVACGHACPTGAIRPLTLDEKHGTGPFEGAGPVRIGLAFVDHGRCLPWSMEKPCIVCEENCPVTPKAIYVSTTHQTLHDGSFKLASANGSTLKLEGARPAPGRFATGDYFAKRSGDSTLRPIIASTEDTITLAPAPSPAPEGEMQENREIEKSGNRETADSPGNAEGGLVEIQVRLQRPVVDPARCIGCGVCEHECPVSGLRAIRLTADNETRSRSRSLLLKSR